MDSVIILPEAWVLVVSALIPLLTSLAVKREGSNATRAFVAAGAVILLTLIEQISGEFTVTGLISTGAIAAITQATWYVTVYKPILGINEKAPDTVSFL